MEASQFEAVVQVSDGIHGDFAEVSDTGKRDEKGSSLGKRGSTVAPFNSHRHEGLNPSTRAIMFDARESRRCVFCTRWCASVTPLPKRGQLSWIQARARWRVGSANPGLQPRSFSCEARLGCLRATTSTVRPPGRVHRMMGRSCSRKTPRMSGTVASVVWP